MPRVNVECIQPGMSNGEKKFQPLIKVEKKDEKKNSESTIAALTLYIRDKNVTAFN